MKFHVNKVWAVISVVAVLCGLFLMTSFQPEPPLFQKRWVRCIEHFGEGSIYGGQPECEQPPAVFGLGYIFSKFGYDMVETLSILTFFLANIATLYLILVLVDAKDKKTPVIMSLAYVLSVLPMNLFCLATSISSVFALIALYILSKNDGDKGILLSSLFFVAALYFKATVTSLIAAVAAAFFIREFIKGQNKFQKEIKPTVKKAILFLTPIFISVILAYMIYPNIIPYVMTAHTVVSKVGFLEGVFMMLKSNPLNDPGMLLFYVIIVSTILYWKKTKDVFAWIFMIAYTASFITKFAAHAYVHNLFSSYYLVHSQLILFIIAGRHLKSTKFKGEFTIFAVSLLFFTGFLGEFSVDGGLSFAGYTSTYTDEYQKQQRGYDETAYEIKRLENIFNGFFKLIPATEGPVLVNWEVNDLLSNISSNIDPKQLENRNHPEQEYRIYSTDHGAGLVRLNFSSAQYYETEDYDIELANEIEDDRFNMIIIGPESWTADISYALRNCSNETLAKFCIVRLPTFDHIKNGRFMSTVMLKDRNACKKLFLDAINYSKNIFPKVCETDEWSANVILAKTIGENRIIRPDGKAENFELGMRCKSDKDVVDKYNYSLNPKIRQDKVKINVIFLILTINIIYFFGFVKGVKWVR